LLLGIPSSAGYRNIHEVANGGWIDGIFIQDQFKATSRLTLNLGFRNDMVYTPIYGPVTPQLLHRQCRPCYRPVHPQRASAQLLGDPGAPCIPTASTLHPARLLRRTSCARSRQLDFRVIKNSLFDWAPESASPTA